MKVIWNSPDPPRQVQKKQASLGEGSPVKSIKVGHNNAEIYIKLGEAVVTLPPSSAKKMVADLKRAVEAWEAEHGTIDSGLPKKRPKRESSAKRVIKALYKSRKVSSKLVSVNTSRRKHLPTKND